MPSYLGDVNWLAVVVCAVISMVIGFIWYGPLFSKPWANMTGWTEEKIAALPKSNMVRSYVLAFIAAFVIALVLAATGSDSIGSGITTAVILWVGFTGATIGVNMLFERRPIALFSIESGYHLAAMIIYSIILSVW